MSSRIPERGSDLEAEGIPDMGDTLEAKEVTGDPQKGYVVPRDHPIAAEDFGTTPFEEEHGEALDDRLAREEPDVLTDAAVDRVPDTDADLDTPFRETAEVGRLVQDDEGTREDVTAEEVGHDVGTDRGGFSAEEAAVHLDPDD